MRCSPRTRRATLPDPAPPGNAPSAGEAAHFRALERLYAAAPINRLFESVLEIPRSGVARIRFTIDERHFHAGGAAHGTSYFKMLDDAAFYAANSLVTDRFLLTTAFNLHFTRPLRAGPVVAEGRWISGQRRVFVADGRLVDADGEEAARGTGHLHEIADRTRRVARLRRAVSDRLPSGLVVGALLRRVNDAGGIGAVLAKGTEGGTILVCIADRQGATRILERGLGPDGRTALIESHASDDADAYWRKRRARDPDLWVIELDIPAAKRFAAETIL